MCRRDINRQQIEMKKILLTLLVACAVNMNATNVYVGGEIMNGDKRDPAYWINGSLTTMSQLDIEPDHNYASLYYAGMAVEYGKVYLCLEEDDRGTRYIQVYSSSGDKICMSYGRLMSFAIANGKPYGGVYGSSGDFYFGSICSHNGYRKNEGFHIVAIDGSVYYTIGSSRNNITGFVANGQTYTNKSSFATNFSVSRIRVIDDNLYLMGKDSNGACIQVNNETRSNIYGYGKICKDYAALKGVSYYIIDDKLIDENGRSMLSTDYEPLQIIGHRGCLYILCRTKTSLVSTFYVTIYDANSDGITRYIKLPSCVNASDFYVEN